MKIRLLLLITTTLFTTMALPRQVRADVNDFTVTSFSADYTLSRKDRQGELHITENISVVFTDNNHGIVRAIPKKYKRHTLKLRINSITSSTNAPTQYTSSSQSDNLVLKIGDPARTVTGQQSYTIDYTVDNVITFYKDHDELFWDVNGDQWRQQFLSVQATLHLPPDTSVTETRCYVGSYGSTSQDCSISRPNSGSLRTVTTATRQALNGNENLSMIVGFRPGYFAKQTILDSLRDNATIILGVAVPPLIVGLWVSRRWWRYGRDLPGRGVIVPEYAAPNDLLPAEVGMLMDYRVDQKDISATIIDLAIKKHLVIVEQTKKKLLKDSKEYILRRTASDTSGLSAYELDILRGIFPDLTADSEVKLSDLKNRFYTTVSKVQKQIPESLTKQGYFPSNPSKSANRIIVVATILVFAAIIIHVWLSVGMLIAAAIAYGFAALMPKRTAKGVIAKDAAEGLKLYMTTAEKERIKLLQSVDAKYAPQTDEPKKTVELFEKLLPYAIVLDVEGTWAQQFKDIYTTPPDWYSGNWHGFNSVYLASSLSNSMQAMGTAFTAPSSSSGSGFGGGGFSGGGGGGGGGGGW